MGQGDTVLYGSHRPYFSRHLTDTGLSGGTTNANGNYSGAVEEFYVTPRAGESEIWISRMMVAIEDTSGIQADEYGNLGSALSNGIHVFLKNDTETLIDLNDGHAITTNAIWGHFCYDVEVKSWGSSPTNELLVARWSFFKGGQYIRVTDVDNMRFGISVNDNLAGLLGHFFLAQGFVYE